MFKKLIAASAVLALFACSSDDGDDEPTPSSNSGNSSASVDGSSSSTDEVSSSSEEAGPTMIKISGFQSASETFGTYGYGYTLGEDLENFWDRTIGVEDEATDCSLEQNDKLKDAQAKLCEKDKTTSILQNLLTTQYSPLHYKVDGYKVNTNAGLRLHEFNLTTDSSQAALGLDVGLEADGKDISSIEGATAFQYIYKGAAHEFRLSVTDEDFWVYNVPATTDTGTVETLIVPIDSLVATESLLATAPAFDLSKVTKFLWVVPFDTVTSTKNKGSLSIDDFYAIVE